MQPESFSRCPAALRYTRFSTWWTRFSIRRWGLQVRNRWVLTLGKVFVAVGEAQNEFCTLHQVFYFLDHAVVNHFERVGWHLAVSLHAISVSSLCISPVKSFQLKRSISESKRLPSPWFHGSSCPHSWTKPGRPCLARDAGLNSPRPYCRLPCLYCDRRLPVDYPIFKKRL